MVKIRQAIETTAEQFLENKQEAVWKLLSESPFKLIDALLTKSQIDKALRGKVGDVLKSRQLMHAVAKPSSQSFGQVINEEKLVSVDARFVKLGAVVEQISAVFHQIEFEDSTTPATQSTLFGGLD